MESIPFLPRRLVALGLAGVAIVVFACLACLLSLPMRVITYLAFGKREPFFSLDEFVWAGKAGAYVSVLITVFLLLLDAAVWGKWMSRFCVGTAVYVCLVVAGVVWGVRQAGGTKLEWRSKEAATVLLYSCYCSAGILAFAGLLLYAIPLLWRVSPILSIGFGLSLPVFGILVWQFNKK